MTDRFLPGVPAAQVEAIFNAAPGNEIAIGKFDSPKSSSALAANTFGFFLNRPHDLPPLPGCDFVTWPAHSLNLEKTVNFPWRGGRHPVLDVLITTPSSLIGIESKRFEPFESSTLSDACFGARRSGVTTDGGAMSESETNSTAETKACTPISTQRNYSNTPFALRAQVNRRGEHHSHSASPHVPLRRARVLAE